MSKQQFSELYEQVNAISKTGETIDGTDQETSLYDWMKEGDCDNMTAEQIAAEWDADRE